MVYAYLNSEGGALRCWKIIMAAGSWWDEMK